MIGNFIVGEGVDGVLDLDIGMFIILFEVFWEFPSWRKVLEVSWKAMFSVNPKWVVMVPVDVVFFLT